MNLIYADLMKVDHQGRLRLICRGTLQDLEKYSLKLSHGMKLVFYNDDVNDDGQKDDLIVEGVVEFDPETKEFVGRIDWDKIKNESNLTPSEIDQLESVSSNLRQQVD
jgi:hypothetical protein